MGFVQHIQTCELIPDTIADVQRYPLTGIDVLIVGAGVGGLTAALECYRKGHNVRIFEREPSISTTGDMFSIGLSGRRWITHWPSLHAEFTCISPRVSLTTIHKHTGEMAVTKAAMGKLDGEDEEPMAIQLRSNFHRMLYDQVRKCGIEIIFSKRAIDYTEDKEKGYVHTEDGGVEAADLIVASDGIGSKAQGIVNGGKVEAKKSGTSMYRASCPPELAMVDPLVKEQFGLKEGQEAIVQVWMGPGTHSVIFVQDDIVTWALNFKESHGSDAAQESWHNATPPSEVLKTMSATPGWGEAFLHLVAATPPSSIIHWPLTWRNPSPIWHSPQARILQLGDSAHSFLPTSGNGATQAIEDSITIATCLQLSYASSTAKKVPIPDVVSKAVKVHNKLRFERVSCAQKLGFYNAFRCHNTDWDGAKKEPKKAQPQIPQWIWRHNPEIYAEQKWNDMSAYEEKIGMGEDAVFQNTNIPPGYTWKPWTIEDLVEEGKHNQVELEGDWS